MIRNLTRGAAHANRNRLLPVRRNTFRILHIAHQPHHRQSRASHTRAHPYATHSRHPAHTHRHRPREPTPARSRGPKTPDHHHHHSRPLPARIAPRARRAAPARTFEISYSKRNTPSGDAGSTSPAPAGVLRTATRRRGAASTARHRRAAAGATAAWRGPRTARGAVAVVVILVVVIVVNIASCARARVASSSSKSMRLRPSVQTSCAKMRIRARFARRLRRERASRGENVRIAFDRRGRRRALTARRATVARLRVRRWIYHCDGICFSVVIIGR